MASMVSDMSGDAALAAIAKPLMGKVLANCISTKTEQLSELQRDRLRYKLAIPDVLTGWPDHG